MRRPPAWVSRWSRGARRLGTAWGRGVVWLGKQIGMVEVAIMTLASGAYLMAGAWLDRQAAAGIALLVAGGLVLWMQLRALPPRRERQP